MPFQKKPENLLLNKMISTFVNQNQHEEWVLACRQENKSTHLLLRELVNDYLRQRREMKRDMGATVLRTLGSR
jgi:hypothetical protein